MERAGPCLPGAFASTKVAFRARSHCPVNLGARPGERAEGLVQTKRGTGLSRHGGSSVEAGQKDVWWSLHYPRFGEGLLGPKQMPNTLDAHPPPPSLSSPTMGSLGASSLTAGSGRSPVTTPGRGRGTDPTSHPLPSGGPHAARSTSRRRFPALCENVQIVAPSLTLKNVPLFTMLFPLITVGLQEIFLENYFRLAGITVRSQGWKTHLNLFSFYPKKSLSPEGSDEFG